MQMQDWAPVIVQAIITIGMVVVTILSRRKQKAEAVKEEAEAEAILDRSTVETVQGLMTASRDALSIKDGTISMLNEQIARQTTRLTDLEDLLTRLRSDNAMLQDQIAKLQQVNQELRCRGGA